MIEVMLSVLIIVYIEAVLSLLIGENFVILLL